MELSIDLHRDVDSGEVVSLGDCCLQRGKPWPKPKARMDTYQVSHRIFNFATSTVCVNTPLKACNIKEVEFVSVPLSMLQHFEQDSHVLTIVGSFLDCSGATSAHLLEEGTSEGTRQLIGMLLDLECSRG